MNDLRILLRVLCSKRRNDHVIASVVAGDSGLLVRYKSAVRHGLTGNDADDFTAIEGESSLDSEFGAVYCPSCHKRYFLPVNEVVAAVHAGEKIFKLSGRGDLVNSRRAKWHKGTSTD